MLSRPAYRPISFHPSFRRFVPLPSPSIYTYRYSHTLTSASSPLRSTKSSQRHSSLRLSTVQTVKFSTMGSRIPRGELPWVDAWPADPSITLTSSQVDIEEFQRGYPDQGNNPKYRTNLDFYSNAAPMRPDNLTYEEFLNQYERNWNELEQNQ